MEMVDPSVSTLLRSNSVIDAAYDYLVDRSQRSILFWDALRKRGNQYIKHLEAGQPPVLVFDYEMVMDGRTFERPVNYSLLRILERRGDNEKRQKIVQERRLTHKGNTVDSSGRPCRPIVVIDPRAGHGPGIGGSKLNSQIGEALEQGYPVYFIMFYTNPEPGQTIARVQQAEVRFLEEVARRHPRAPKPAVIGNCQAGWAAALIVADRPDITGPMVLNGSPLSYWGGVEGANPIRYRGGLLGGVWLTSFCCDLGCGWFDGAHLVANFEDLNPANTYWTKYYHLFANVDTEEKRFLEFEKWWGGFFKMTAEEIHFIVDSLFIGNELEQGSLRLGDKRAINLKNFKEPILVFASNGDNITPPPQALNWIYKVYGSVDEIKRCGQVIIYIVHESIGHLGIFVSGKVAKKEHRQILDNIGWVDYLAPGLYEMVIKTDSVTGDRNDLEVCFEARNMENILKLDDGLEDEEAFVPVSSISRFSDFVYRHTVRPWIKSTLIPSMDSWIRFSHPLRMQRYMISDRNLLCWPIKWTAKSVNIHRRPVQKDNTFVVWENQFSKSIQRSLDYLQSIRDSMQEFLFKTIYGSDWVKSFFSGNGNDTDAIESGSRKEVKTIEEDKLQVRRKTHKGGYVEACVRALIAVLNANRKLSTRDLEKVEKIVQQDPILRKVAPNKYKRLVKEQALILETDLAQALADLVVMVPDVKDRIRIVGIANCIVSTEGRKPENKEKIMLSEIEKAFEIGNEHHS